MVDWWWYIFLPWYTVTMAILWLLRRGNPPKVDSLLMGMAVGLLFFSSSPALASLQLGGLLKGGGFAAMLLVAFDRLISDISDENEE